MSYETYLAHAADTAADDSGFEKFLDDWDGDFGLHAMEEDFTRAVYDWYVDLGYIKHTPEELKEDYAEWLGR